MWLTYDQVWNWVALSDKEKLRWAIMTEDALKTQQYSKVACASAKSDEEDEEEADEEV